MLMKKIKNILLTLVLTLLVNSINAQANNLNIMRISHNNVIPDVELIQFVEKYQAKSKAVYFWAAGLSGVHRIMTNSVNTDDLLNKARQEATSFFESAIKSNELRIERFLKNNVKDDLLLNEKVQIQARSLLNIRRQLKNSYAISQSNQPLFYGIEVEGTTSQLEMMQQSSSVNFSQLINVNQPQAIDKNFKPEQYKKSIEYKDIHNSKPDALYENLLAVLAK